MFELNIFGYFLMFIGILFNGFIMTSWMKLNNIKLINYINDEWLNSIHVLIALLTFIIITNYGFLDGMLTITGFLYYLISCIISSYVILVIGFFVFDYYLGYKYTNVYYYLNNRIIFDMFFSEEIKSGPYIISFMIFALGIL
jgi:hypothetical protein